MEENDLRERGINSLRIFLNKEQNIKIIEKNMYDLSKNYLLDLYETINDINIGTKLNNILHDIKNCKIGWKHNSFKDLIFEEEEQNNFSNFSSSEQSLFFLFFQMIFFNPFLSDVGTCVNFEINFALVDSSPNLTISVVFLSLSHLMT